MPPRSSLTTAFVLLAYAVGAVVVTWSLWHPLGERTSAVNPGDTALFAWLLEWTPHAVAHGDNPWFTDTLNAPTGINLMWNNGMSLPALIVWPVTALWGGLAAVTVVLALGMAGSAATAYGCLRGLDVRPVAAAVGGAVFGFSPAMLAQSHGHPNLVFNVLVPVILYLVVRLVVDDEPRRRHAILLGLAAGAQVLIGEEVLVLTGVVAVVLVAVLALNRPELVEERVRIVALRGAQALGVFVLVAGLPLGFQLFGPLEQHGLPFDPAYYSADLAGYVVPTELQWLHTDGSVERSTAFPGGLEEHTAYLGWPLAILAVALLVLRWRNVRIRVALLTAVVAAVFALGERLTVDGAEHGPRLPWDWVDGLPGLEHVVQTRFALLTAGLVGAGLAFALDDLARYRLTPRVVGAVVAAGALVPLLPAQLAAADAPETPELFASGRAADALDCDGTVLVLPYPSPAFTDPMLWQADADMSFAMPGGYFIGPGPGGQAYFGGASSFTRALFESVFLSGVLQPATPANRRAFAADLEAWDVCAAVLGPGYNSELVRDQATRLIGYEPEPVDGVVIWRDLSDVRSLAD
ncbi:MAG TPA: hypothetical protein VEX15_22485 [Nocardioidaceae bacterium]|nr:hypothetical protein [Nocardioidaceae bacterium]